MAIRNEKELEKSLEEEKEAQAAIERRVETKLGPAPKDASSDRGKEWKDLAMRLKRLYEEREARQARLSRVS